MGAAQFNTNASTVPTTTVRNAPLPSHTSSYKMTSCLFNATNTFLLAEKGVVLFVKSSLLLELRWQFKVTHWEPLGTGGLKGNGIMDIDVATLSYDSAMKSVPRHPFYNVTLLQHNWFRHNLQKLKQNLLSHWCINKVQPQLNMCMNNWPVSPSCNGFSME